MGAAGAVWIVPIVVIAFLVRTIVVYTMRNRRPNAAAAVDQWWTWAPLAAVVAAFIVVCIVLIVREPLLGVGLAVLGGVLAYFGLFSASSTGSPFRPRRR